MTNLNNTTAMIAILRDLVATDGAYVNASAALQDAVKRASEAGIKSGDLDGKPKGKWFVETQTEIAFQRFNEEEMALWLDPAVKQRAGNEKHKLAVRINSVMKRIRDHLAANEAASVTDTRNEEQPETTKKGAQTGPKKSVKDVCGDDLQKLWTRVRKDRDNKDAPELAIDHDTLLGFIKSAADLLKITLKDK
jgi:Arc/MetJ-type ribon-helix-helix transcriptional regulator